MPGILGFRGISVEDDVTKVQELLFGPKDQKVLTYNWLCPKTSQQTSSREVI